MLQFAMHLLIDLVLALVGLGCSMRAWSSGKRRQSMHYGLGVFVIVGSLALHLAERQYHIGALIALKLEASKYESCKSRGASIVSGKILSVCSLDAQWNEALFTEAVIYDSSDELANKDRHYSARWRAAALSLEPQAPFSQYSFEAYPLGRHYYLVTFNYDTSSIL
ncbi:hypothetical protein [Trinickia fusca]|uniref:hypothetical protein n=1 Tax=Trinickia fusca TaxID=2419777 RepID=UPI0011C36FF1|nr:hypothetical protein [Trinickia fusca]